MKFSRRTFISAITLASITGKAKAYFPHGFLPPVYPAVFGGNPNAVFSSIDTSGGIVMSRTSGYCIPANATIGSPGSPAFVQVSASAILATGTITSSNGTAVLNASPISDLEFTWNFGDPSGTEVFTNPATGLMVNANTGQSGNEAAYAYRTVGPKYITLKIRGQNGSGGYVTATATSTFTVNDLTAVSGYKARYADSTGGTTSSDSYDGTAPVWAGGVSTVGPKATLSSTTGLMSVVGVANGSSNACGFLANGSNWQDQGNIKATGGQSSLRFTSYVGAVPSSTAPVVAISGSTTNSNPFVVGNGSNGFGAGTPTNDIVTSFINYTSNGGSLAPCAVNGSSAEDPAASLYDVYVDNATFTETGGSAGAIGCTLGSSWNRLLSLFSGDCQRLGSWNCNFTAPSTGALSTVYATGLLTIASAWVFFVGGSVVGDGGNATGEHAIYGHVGGHSLYRWMSTQPAGGVTKTFGRNYAINLESDPIPANANTNCGIYGKISLQKGGAGDSATLEVTELRSSNPVSVGMIMQGLTGGVYVKVTAALSTTITSMTWAGGIGTINVAAGHNVVTGKSIQVVVTGTTPAGYNGTWIAVATSSTAMTITGQMSNPGSSPASPAGSYTGGSYTITPNSLSTIPAMSGSLNGFALVAINSVFSGTYVAATNTISVESGSLILGPGQSNINTGDTICGLNLGGNTVEVWSPIGTVTGSPATSFVLVPPSGFSWPDQATPITLYTVSATFPTVVSNTLIDGCLLATMKGAHSGNSSSNDASYLVFQDVICQASAFVNLQSYAIFAECIEGYTMRNNRIWSVGSSIADIFALGCNTGNLASSIAWRIYGNSAYFGVAAEIIGYESVQPTSTLPMQFTNNNFWNSASSGLILGVYASYNANSLFNNNNYNAPNSANFINDAPSSPVSYATWRGLNSGYFDVNSTNVNNATPATGPMSLWNLNSGAGPQQWSDFGP